MLDLPPAVYLPAFGALVTVIGVLWKAWRGEAAERLVERKEGLERFDRLLRDAMDKEDA